jgi:hypothetical protein
VISAWGASLSHNKFMAINICKQKLDLNIRRLIIVAQLLKLKLNNLLLSSEKSCSPEGFLQRGKIKSTARAYLVLAAFASS